MPFLIGIFYAVRRTLAISPEALNDLSGHLYSWSYIQAAIPIEESFLGLNLAETSFLMVALVGVSTWAQTKTTVTVATDERARTQQQMMQWLLPVIFMFFSFGFPSGVSLYWVVTSFVGVAFNVVTYGFPLLRIPPMVAPPAPRPAAPIPATSDGSGGERSRPARELRTSAHGTRRGKRKNRRRRT